MDIFGPPSLDPPQFSGRPENHEEKLPKPVTMRDFHDIDETRKAIYDKALSAAQSAPVVVNDKYQLALHDVHYQGPEAYSIKDQKDAILRRKSLGRKMVGTWRLSDATGLPVEEKTSTLAKIPYLTPRGTFINKGSEYAIINQLRLRPGIFSRVKENGELESHVNLAPGTARSHRYFLDPAKGVFYAKIEHAKIPLYPLLREMGVAPDQMRAAWGDELHNANAQENSQVHMRKFYDRLLSNKEQTLGDPQKAARLVEKLTSAPLDPEVTRRTLGHGYDRLSPDAILATTQKLLALSRGESDVDDRDNLAYQMLVGPDDVIAERLGKDAGYVRQALLRRATLEGSLKHVLPGALNHQVKAALLFSGLGQNLEEVGPAELLDKRSRLTRMGEGGIPDSSAIPDEARAVQPSQLSFVDPIRTPESLRVGVDTQIASGARRGSDGRLYAPFKDPRTGEVSYKSPQDIADLTVAFPGSLTSGDKHVSVVAGGRMRRARRRDVDLVAGPFENSFSAMANLVPFKSASKGQRGSMGARMISQALPLRDAEAPLVQVGVPGSDGRSFEQDYGSHFGALRSKDQGRVVSVTPDEITMIDATGQKVTHELHNNFLLNRKTLLHQTPLVKPGDMVQPDQLLAKSNFTDDQGQAALGKNVRTAFMSFKGNNYEDAVSISQSLADKLTSEQAYQRGFDKTPDHKMGRGAYLSLFPGKYSKQQLSGLDEQGVAKPGTTVNYGDPIVVAIKAVEQTMDRVHRKGQRSWQDASVIWDHAHPGVVTDAAHDDSGVNVFVKTHTPSEVGDKLAGRHGNKGVISSITPNSEMPRDASGKPFELLLNPQGVTTRGNPSQVFETLLGKIAAKTGKPYRVTDFEIADLTDYVQKELDKHGLKDTEDLIDPETEQKIPGVLTGNMHVMKLMHMAEDKEHARSLGGYTQDQTPAKGGHEGGGAKRLALQDTNALISHGAYGILRDSHQIRGQANDDYWLSFMQGHEPPPPKIPFVYRKFIASLKGSGVNVVPDSRGMHVMALTDKDVNEMAGDRNITNSSTVDFGKGLKPVVGGLFDPRLTGGHQNEGTWAAIPLAEPMPNPVFEEPIRRLLGLTQKQYEGIIAGREQLPGTRPETPENSGPAALARALKQIDVPKELAAARLAIKGTRKGARDAAIKKLSYLKNAERLGIHPGDWILSRAPVLPPAFRPISTMQDNDMPLVSDANYLYKGLIEANDALRGLQGRVADTGDERLNVYNAFKAVVGLGDPIQPQYREKNIRGILQHVLGSSPKTGTVQRRLLSANMDMVGRGVITPNPDFDMDTVGLPEEGAWSAYRNFVIRRLSRRGMPLTQAIQHVEDRSPIAKQELLSEMEQRPVLLNRAPVLHKYGIMAFKPRLVSGNTVQISPLVTQPFGADFDGDSVCGDSLVTVQLPLATAVKYGLQDSSALVPKLMGPGQPVIAANGGCPVVCRVALMDFPRIEPARDVTSRGVVVHDVPEGVRILSYDMTLKRCTFETVTEWTVHPDVSCVLVAIGFAGRASHLNHGDGTAVLGEDHSVYCYDPSRGGMSRRSPTDAASCYVPVVTQVTTPNLENVVSGDELLSQFPMDFDLGWWIGATAMAGASFWPGEHRLAFAGKGQALRNRYFALTGRFTRSCATDRLSLTLGIEPLAMFIKRWIAPSGLDRTAYRLPPFTPLLPLECRRGVLHGVLDAADVQRGNRSVSGELRFPCLSPALADDVLSVCQTLGIRMSLRKARSYVKRPETPSPNLPQAVCDVYLADGDIKLIDPKKQQLLESRALHLQQIDTVPVDLRMCRYASTYLNLLTEQHVRFDDPGTSTATTLAHTLLKLQRDCSCSRVVARTTIDRLRELGFASPELDAWEELVDDESVRWQKLEILEHLGPRTLYDVTVPSTKLFSINGGVVVYDTMQYHVPVSEDERKEALERMLPSKNLISPQDFKSPMYAPRQEYLAGLFRATQPPAANKRSRTFALRADVIKAFRRGELSIDDAVDVAE